MSVVASDDDVLGDVQVVVTMPRAVLVRPARSAACGIVVFVLVVDDASEDVSDEYGGEGEGDGR